MRSLVTGGAGFIGSHLVDALAARGDDVLVVDDFSSGKRENLAGAVDAGAEVAELDVADAQAMFETVASFEPQSVFHLAAQIDVRRSMADPGFDARLNVVGTVNALEAATRAGASKFVFTSTGGAIYGEGTERAGELPFAESARCEPFSIYGQSKLAAEGYIDLYSRTRGLPVTVLRLGNIYGPRQDPATEAGVVAIFCEAGRDGGRPTVFGTGEQTRDYVHVADVVAALLAAEASDDPGPVNVGTGVETSVLDLVGYVGRAFDRDDFEPEFAPAREGEIERTVLDTVAAAERLGWRAEHSIETGLEQTIEAIREPL
ncbi:MAG TPA: NAD-dependent epimerase/dehydratase family protein [Solirubrobacterales bacterium]|jgi:UDP-glucose 4-epimerase|nr:NAD-dependent epimerase/dehydratase family protein [Solirubrobacterales bacterium]